jgi:rhamnose utilization protein RhaD (predicted bifunctional aldolase and dehydrogenase)
MSNREEALMQLIAMSNRLGDPQNDYVILGEGNSSARIDDESFYVKASGVEMRTADAAGFVAISFQKTLSFLDRGSASDEEIKQALMDARLYPEENPRRPSVETFIHALALTLGEANFVGHTHPAAVNMILCSEQAEEAVKGRLFPDEIVVCGPAPVYVPYVDPGLPLARRVREAIQRYLDDYGEPPRTIMMQNHGLIALGKTAQQVENITAMAVKAARVLVGAYALGGPHFMTPEAVERIHTRPDELYRRKTLQQT